VNDNQNSRGKSIPKLPSGKFKGMPISQVPRWYLKWLAEWEHTWPWLRTIVKRELSGIPQATEAETIDEAMARTVRSLEDQLAQGAG